MLSVKEEDPVFSPGQVAKLFAVDPKTVTRWVQSKRLKGFKTPGGHIRIRASAIREYLQMAEGDDDPDI